MHAPVKLLSCTQSVLSHPVVIAVAETSLSLLSHPSLAFLFLLPLDRVRRVGRVGLVASEGRGPVQLLVGH